MVEIARIRNVALVGHNGNGKTSLAEAMLYRAGLTSRLGRVEQGNLMMIRDPLEREWQQSLALNPTSFEWRGYKINLLDTPGYADFVSAAAMGLAVADLAIFVMDGVAGIHGQDTILWHLADRMKTPRIIFVNKLDREHSSFGRVLDQIRDEFGAKADPVELPLGEASSFHGFAELLENQAVVYDSGHAERAPFPDEVIEQGLIEHQRLLEDVVEMDDDLLEQYLEGAEPSGEQLERVLHDAVDATRIFPVLCGSATVPIGADFLTDLICRIGPAPGDLGSKTVRAGNGTSEVEVDPAGPALVYVFKTTVDEYLGQISYFRVLRGTVRSDDVLVNARSGERERFHQLSNVVGDKQRVVASVEAGDIGAVTKLGDTRTGDTLGVPGPVLVYEPPPLPSSTYGRGISPGNPADEERMSSVLHRLVAEDPSLTVEFEPSTGQSILRGRGETHLDVALARLERAGASATTEDLKVPYRETLASGVEVEGRYKKQTGGHGQFGVARVRFEPLPLGHGFQFESEVTGGAIPRNLIPAVGAGIEEAMARGGDHGFPLVDLRAVCVDGKHHSVDSSEMSFKMAGSLALREAVRTVGVRVLEPVSELRITAAIGSQGDILSDVNARRGQVLGTDTGDLPGTVTVQARVPTSELGRYAIDLRSMTSGTGSFELTHWGYQEVPASVLSRLQPAT